MGLDKNRSSVLFGKMKYHITRMHLHNQNKKFPNTYFFSITNLKIYFRSNNNTTTDCVCIIIRQNDKQMLKNVIFAQIVCQIFVTKYTWHQIRNSDLFLYNLTKRRNFLEN